MILKKLKICVSSILLLSIFFTACEDPNIDKLNQVGWLTGVWIEKESPQLMEEWILDENGMNGLGFHKIDQDTIPYEKLSIHGTEKGLILKADVRGNEGVVEFESTLLADSLVVFENPSHDFPNYISYNRVSKNSLRVEVRGNLEMTTLNFIRTEYDDQ